MPIYSPELGAFPSSWYCVGFSHELPAGAVRSQRIAGQEVVVFRTATGQAAALDAHCSHLGAHLGHGGTVEGDSIRCPFHGFCFDGSGACTKTGYGTKPPPKAQMRAWPLIERHGVLFVYFDRQGRPPTWEVAPADTDGFTPIRHHSFFLRSHPQEIAENSVDIGHFKHIHGYDDVRQLTPLRTDGAYLNVRYGLRRRREGVGGFRDISIEFEIHQYGLGCARVEARTSVGLASRQLVLVTPLGEDQVELRIGNAIKPVSGRDAHWLLRLMPTRWLAALAFKEYKADVTQDLAIWTNKRYVNPPALASGDGPIGAYRKWARQFYAEEGPLPSRAPGVRRPGPSTPVPPSASDPA